MTAPDPVHPRWPADRFFWTILDAPGIDRPGPLPVALLDDLAADVPLPVDDLFAVAAPLHGARLLVCAARRSDLAEVPHVARTLCPASIPEAFAVRADPSSLNLLVAHFEPAPVRRDRLHRHARRAAAVLLAAALVTIGLLRRADQERHTAAIARSTHDELCRALAPDANPVTATLALEQELSRLRAAARASVSFSPPPDAALQLATLLNTWPSRVPSKPQSVSVSPAAIAASVSLDGDPSPFLHALRAPPGWTLEEPRTNTASGITRVSIRMKPAPIPAPHNSEGGAP